MKDDVAFSFMLPLSYSCFSVIVNEDVIKPFIYVMILTNHLTYFSLLIDIIYGIYAPTNFKSRKLLLCNRLGYFNIMPCAHLDILVLVKNWYCNCNTRLIRAL